MDEPPRGTWGKHTERPRRQREASKEEYAKLTGRRRGQLSGLETGGSQDAATPPGPQEARRHPHPHPALGASSPTQRPRATHSPQRPKSATRPRGADQPRVNPVRGHRSALPRPPQIRAPPPARRPPRSPETRPPQRGAQDFVLAATGITIPEEEVRGC